MVFTHEKLKQLIIDQVKSVDDRVQVVFGPLSESRDNVVTGDMWDQPILFRWGAEVPNENVDKVRTGVMALHTEEDFGIRRGYGRWDYVVWYKTE